MQIKPLAGQAGALALALAAAWPLAATAQGAQAAAPATPATASAQPAVPLRTLLVGPASSMPEGEGIQLHALPAGMDSAGLREQLQALLGQPITPALVEAVLADINRRLQGAGFHVASVPQQDVTGGTVRIELWQGRIAALRVEGPAAVAARAPALAAGNALPDPDRIAEDLAWLEKALPGRRATAQFSPGELPGDMAVHVRIVEPPRVSLTAGADNTGSRMTGSHRVNLGLQVNQVLAPDDQLGYRLSADPEFRHTINHSLNYAVPLPTRHILSATLVATRLEGKLPAPFDLRGSSGEAALRYEVPLRLAGAWTDSLVAGFDYKRSNNNLLFSQAPVTDTVTEIGQFSLAYQAAVRDPWGDTSGSARFVWSPGGLFPDQDDAAFDAARPGATARYRIAQLQLQRRTGLPMGAWTSALTLQKADANLLGSEQLGAGGVHTVRGFQEGVAFGDSGWLWRNDWRLPALRSPGGGWFAEFGLFVDAAGVRVHRPLPGEPGRRGLAGAGVGVLLGLPGGLTLEAQWGKRLRSDVVSQPEGGSRAHFALSGWWAF